MPTSTTNFAFQKPLVNNAIDADLWGGILNTNWDDVDAIIPNVVASKTTSFNVLASEFGYAYQIDASSAAVTASLPAASSVFNGFAVFFRAEDAANTITIDPNGSETINGLASLTIAQTDDTVGVVCDGSNWVTLYNVEKVVLEFATDAQADAGTATDVALVPSNFGGSGRQDLIANGGYQYMPGGLIWMWGQTSSFSASTSVTLPFTLPNEILQAYACKVNTDGAQTAFGTGNFSTTGFDIYSGTSVTTAARWHVIGR